MINSRTKNRTNQIPNELQICEYLNKKKFTNKWINTIIYTQIDKNIKTKNMTPYDNVTSLSQI